MSKFYDHSIGIRIRGEDTPFTNEDSRATKLKELSIKKHLCLESSTAKVFKIRSLIPFLYLKEIFPSYLNCAMEENIGPHESCVPIKIVVLGSIKIGPIKIGSPSEFGFAATSKMIGVAQMGHFTKTCQNNINI